MVAKRQCSFCAQEIEPGTGTIFVKRDGTVYQFCSSSCRKQQLRLGRIGHRFKWTRAYELKRAAERSSAERAPTAAPAPRLSRVRPSPERGVPPAPSAAPPGRKGPPSDEGAPVAAPEPATKKPRARRAPAKPSDKATAKPAAEPAAKPPPDGA